MLFYSLLFQLRAKKRNGGFTLLELILSLAIGSIVILTMFSLLGFTVSGCIKAQSEDEILLNGRHAIEYIKKEIKSGDKIISIDKIKELDEKYEDNIGFIIFKYDPNESEGYKYNYVTFYLKDNKIFRIAANRNNHGLPKSTSFSGYNVVAENVSSIEGTHIDFERKIIRLNIKLKDVTNREYQLQSIINIRCTVES